MKGRFGARVQQARDLDFRNCEDKSAKLKAFDFDKMQRSVDQVNKMAQDLKPAVCFSHNDLLSGNILVPKQVPLLF